MRLEGTSSLVSCSLGAVAVLLLLFPVTFSVVASAVAVAVAVAGLEALFPVSFLYSTLYFVSPRYIQSQIFSKIPRIQVKD
jgi:hypothetical protein